MDPEEYEEVERAFCRDDDGSASRPSRVWADVVLALRRSALQLNLSAGEYHDVLDRASNVLRELARATGRLREDSYTKKILALGHFWDHASDRNLVGLDPIKVDINGLVRAFGSYQKLPMQTPYLDWVFLDAYLFHVCFKCKQDFDQDVLRPGDSGTLLPRKQSMMASASDTEQAHPLLLELKIIAFRGVWKIAPTFIGVAAGVTLLYFDWWKTGAAILGIVLFYRGMRALRWIARMPLRRRVGGFLQKLESAYGLLVGPVIPTKELRRAVDEALQTGGERLVFGAAFWAVLDHVCTAHPNVLNLQS